MADVANGAKIGTNRSWTSARFRRQPHCDAPDEILRDYTGLLMGDSWSGLKEIELGVTVHHRHVPHQPGLARVAATRGGRFPTDAARRGGIAGDRPGRGVHRLDIAGWP